jgi:arylsulfatase A-like enzyme
LAPPRPASVASKNFAAMVTHLDRQVGRVLERLEERGLARNTLVIFTSDNGPHAEGNHDSKFFTSSGPLRGIKRDLYEGGIRVPLIARWPGRAPQGLISDQVLAFWDFLPTFGALAGATVPSGLDLECIVSKEGFASHFELVTRRTGRTSTCNQRGAKDQKSKNSGKSPKPRLTLRPIDPRDDELA